MSMFDKANLVMAIQTACDYVLQRDEETPAEINDRAVLIATLAPCPFCEERIDATFSDCPMQEDWEEKLLQDVLTGAIPERWRPVVRAMMVHLDQCPLYGRHL
jgi:hypothetical protein